MYNNKDLTLKFYQFGAYHCVKLLIIIAYYSTKSKIRMLRVKLLLLYIVFRFFRIFPYFHNGCICKVKFRVDYRSDTDMSVQNAAKN